MSDRQEQDIELESKDPPFRVTSFNPSLPVSRSLLEIASRSPTAAITSIAALFITVILSIVIPVMFSPCQSS